MTNALLHEIPEDDEEDEMKRGTTRKRMRKKEKGIRNDRSASHPSAGTRKSDS